MKRILVDASVLIAGCGSNTGASRAILSAAEIGLFRIVVTRQILDESERNLRKKLPTSLPVLADVLVRSRPEILPDPDPKASARWHDFIHVNDAQILEAAVVTQVNRIVSLNTRHFTPQLGAKIGIPIQTPEQFVQELRSIVTDGLD
jgi:predicted nucleic acid-binding protein